MRHGFLEVPDFSIDIYNIIEKSGARTEYSLLLNNDLYNLGKRLSDVPLRFASIVVAEPSTENQQFHADSNHGERAIIYLNDVHESSNGPIEFKEYGKILGAKGTFVHYSANEIHRGCSSDISRYALALAFDSSDTAITTIGAAANTICDPENDPHFDCPSGYSVKSPIPAPASFANDTEKRDYCCNKKSSYIFVIIAVLVALGVFLLFKFAK